MCSTPTAKNLAPYIRTIWVFLHLLQEGEVQFPCGGYSLQGEGEGEGLAVAAAGWCEELELDLLFGVAEFPFLCFSREFVGVAWGVVLLSFRSYSEGGLIDIQ